MHDSDWIVPLLWRSEFRNVLAGAIRKRLLPPEAAIDLIGKAEAQFAQKEFVISSAAVLRLAADSRLSAYDCEFVALAQEQGVPLVTEDRLILREFPDVAVPLATFAK